MKGYSCTVSPMYRAAEGKTERYPCRLVVIDKNIAEQEAQRLNARPISMPLAQRDKAKPMNFKGKLLPNRSVGDYERFQL